MKLKFAIKVSTKKDKRDAILFLNKMTGVKIAGCYLDDDNNILPPHDFDLSHPFLIVNYGRIDGSYTSDNKRSYEFPKQLPEIVQEILNSSEEYIVEDVGDYTATISLDGIEVGCQTISFEKFDEIAEKVALVRKK